MASLTPYIRLLRFMRIVVWVFIGGVVSFSWGINLMNIDKEMMFAYSPETHMVLRWFVLLIIILLIPLSGILFYQRIRNLDKSRPLDQLLRLYRDAWLTKYILLEIAAFLAVMIFYLTGDHLLLMIVAVVVLYMILSIPSVQRIDDELNLSDSADDFK